MIGDYEIIDLIRREANIIRVEIVTGKMKNEILKLEKERIHENIPLINKGVEKALEEDEALVIIRDIDKEVFMNVSIKPTLTLISDSGILIGEEVYDKEELDELHQDNNVTFLSDTFVRYDNLSNTGEKQYLIVSPASKYFVSNHDLEKVVKSLTVGLPSISTDNFIKNCFDIHDNNSGTLIVGFTK
ncbi:hypothetical protein [Candidatus Methanosphaera massiliense]|jgi:hypothetical protein|uniref:hypothetical protein n=1 Tax=Methanosphaera TaxID=2316 RepID=UPI0023802313|nr:hypothetical protein [Candidatus Methanosphaera massiliense]MDD6285820.1 hypothetical protein [Methanobacteriaceae archaeon]MDE4078133.1 hypothetical protein [Candidatus Methanosphaera massiliense]MDY2745415.1 hypothetical protein [Methanosphaera sp.]